MAGQVIVRFKAGTSEAQKSSVHGRRNGSVLKKLLLARTELVNIGTSRNPRSVARAYERMGEVDYAEPNFIRRPAATFSPDANFAEQWGLNNSGQSINGTVGVPDADIDAAEAWDKTVGLGLSGFPAITVGVVDTGIDTDHDDLLPNLWGNLGEVGGGKETNGIDDDQNGFADDVRGFDFVDNDNNPVDDQGHGTYIAGTIGARGGDGMQVTGASWSVKLGALRVCSPNPNVLCTDAAIANAFTYAHQMGMRVVSAALSGPDVGVTVQTAIANAPNTLFVVAAGNGGGNAAGDDNDVTPEYPCAYPETNIICVTASDQSDELASFGNYGDTAVDLAAPGVNVLSTWPGEQLAYLNGTSPATGYTAGAAALVLARKLSSSVASVKSRLINNVDAKPSLAGKTVSGGRLNVNKALPPPSTGVRGTGDGGPFVSSSIDFFATETAHDVAVQPDGKILMAGYTETGGTGDFAISRFNYDGSLDTTFSGDGKTTAGLPAIDDEAFGIAFDRVAGRIVVAGRAKNPEDTPVVASYNYNGTQRCVQGIDMSGGVERHTAVGVQSGQIVAAGYHRPGPGEANIIVSRWSADNCNPDASFGDTWLKQINLGGVDQAFDIDVQQDGKLVVVGRSGPDPVVLRLTAEGQLDTSFGGGDGYDIQNFGGSSERFRGAALQADSKIVVAGGSNGGEQFTKLAFTSEREGNKDVYTASPLGLEQGVTRLTTATGWDQQPKWSPDGTRIAFASERDGDQELYLMDWDGENEERLTNSAGGDSHPSWSPDGDEVVFRSDRHGNAELYKIDLASSTETRLTNHSATDENPDWSPDGSKIAFTSDRDGNSEIYAMNADGSGTPTNLTNDGGDDHNPIWSPDGSKILFRTDRDGNGEIYSMTSTGGSPTNLTNHSANDELASWSGSGNKIVFQTSRDGNQEIYTMDADGSDPFRVTNNSAADELSDWQPLNMYAVARYTSGGALDSTFSGDGKLTHELGGGQIGHEGTDVAVQDDLGLAGRGEITVVGTANEGFSLKRKLFTQVRFAHDGTEGTSTLGVNASDTETSGVTLQPNDGNAIQAATVAGDFNIFRYLGGMMSLNVTPETGLNPAGQTVTVSGSGMEPNSTVGIDQCRPGSCVGQTTTPTDSSGSFSTSIEVDWDLDGLEGDCRNPASPPCFVRATRSGGGPQQVVTAPISFQRPVSMTSRPSDGALSSNQAVEVGQPVTQTATVTGDATGGSPTEKVEFFVCGPIAVTVPATCGAGSALPGNPQVLTAGPGNSGTATSGAFVAGTPGRYCFRAEYAGSDIYNAGSDSSRATCISVRQPVPTLGAVEDFYRLPHDVMLQQAADGGLIENDLYPTGATVTATLDTNPLHGDVTLQPDGSFTYDPDPGYVGTDDFTYTLDQQGGGQSQPGTVRLEVTSEDDPLQGTRFRGTTYVGTRFRGTRFRGTRFRDIEQISMVTYAQCRSRYVWVNPQVTMPHEAQVQVTAALYDSAGERIAVTDGYLVNDYFYGDPFQPTVLTWPVWSTPVAADGAYVEVLVEVDPGTPDAYTVRGTVLCAT